MSVPDTLTFDALILGGGIAGVSLLAQLAPHMKVALLERERSLAYHATGRSAAMLAPGYGAPAVHGLTRASRRFLAAPPPDFDGALLSPRPILYLARPRQSELLVRMAAAAARDRRLRWLTPTETRGHVPILRASRVSAALLDQDGADIDVARLHEGYLRTARSAGARIFAGLGFTRIEQLSRGWRVQTPEIAFQAPILVNATGAWADETAEAAGLRRQDLTPFSRTVAMIGPPGGISVQTWPVVIDAGESFYVRPVAHRLLVTSANETPSVPCDAAPEERQIALALHRYQQACDHVVVRVDRRWAGLRTFAPDRAPVIGWSSEAPGFFWHAALGGVGVQTAPAASRLSAALLMEKSVPADLLDAGVKPACFSPARRMTAAGQA